MKRRHVIAGTEAGRVASLSSRPAAESASLKRVRARADGGSSRCRSPRNSGARLNSQIVVDNRLIATVSRARGDRTPRSAAGATPRRYEERLGNPCLVGA